MSNASNRRNPPTAHQMLRRRLHERAGLAAHPTATTHTLSSLQKTEWSAEFELLMRNRLVMGALRYGLLNAPGKPQYDRPGSIVRRLQAYVQTGNLELLVDIANMCLLEFVEGRHPLRHFAASDDGEHAKSL